MSDTEEFHGFQELTDSELKKSDVYSELIYNEDEEKVENDKFEDTKTDSNNNSSEHNFNPMSPPFYGFGPETVIPGKIEICDKDGEPEIVRRGRLGKPRGLDLKQKERSEVTVCTGTRSGREFAPLSQEEGSSSNSS